MDKDNLAALMISSKIDHTEILKLLISKGAYFKDYKNIIIEEILINNLKNKEINNCFLMINTYRNKINYRYKDKKTILFYIMPQ